MRRLVHLHSDGAADVVGRSAIRCLWCSAVVAVPPYRPHSFFFRGSAEEPEGAPPHPHTRTPRAAPRARAPRPRAPPLLCLFSVSGPWPDSSQA
jgi:hypothetical protein